MFNYPPVKPGEPAPPSDLKTYYIKRCVGIPGDVLQIHDEAVVVNGKAFSLPTRAQTFYFVKTTEVLDDRFFRRYDIVNDFVSTEGPFINWQPVEVYDEATKTNILAGYHVNMTRETLAQFKKLDWVQSIEPMREQAGQAGAGVYGTPANAWNRDNYGPLTIPKKGMTVPLNSQTIAAYGTVIKEYEGNEQVILTPTSVQIGGKLLTEYTFKQDYYFMMGDNRHNSDDSRYWGFVPEDHVVGKAVFVWMSLDPVPADAWHKVRWSRLFRVIE